ncbi:MAG: aldose epimerase family protein [Pseudoflavonifractor sp.]|nr:aldose epimerase family protein [Pseudoflavonifractor sp.]
MNVTQRPFDVMGDGRAVSCWTLTNSRGMTAEVLTYGATLRTLSVPAPKGIRDVALGFDSVSAYQRHQDTAMGGVVGRVAGRIGGAAFSLNGREYALSPSQPPNCLHGGFFGFHRQVWKARPTENGALELFYVSHAGEEGFPGRVTVWVTYALTADNALSISYRAETDAPTVLNLTSHSYFNLAGHAAGDVAEHRVEIWADRYLELGAGSVPTGQLLNVAGTPFDLRRPALLGPGLASGHPQIQAGQGYDHCFAVGGTTQMSLRLVARVEADGVRMDCETTQPGLVFYTANYLEAPDGKGGAHYRPRSGLCLEAQNWPDAIHHRDFPDSVLRPGETYTQETCYRFSLC